MGSALERVLLYSFLPLRKLHKTGKLIGMLSVHVDDIMLQVTVNFMKKLLKNCAIISIVAKERNRSFVLQGLMLKEMIMEISRLAKMNL